MDERDKDFLEFKKWCERNILSGSSDKKFSEILAKEDMARIVAFFGKLLEN